MTNGRFNCNSKFVISLWMLRFYLMILWVNVEVLCATDERGNVFIYLLSQRRGGFLRFQCYLTSCNIPTYSIFRGSDITTRRLFLVSTCHPYLILSVHKAYLYSLHFQCWNGPPGIEFLHLRWHVGCNMNIRNLCGEECVCAASFLIWNSWVALTRDASIHSSRIHRYVSFQTFTLLSK